MRWPAGLCLPLAHAAWTCSLRPAPCSYREAWDSYVDSWLVVRVAQPDYAYRWRLQVCAPLCRLGVQPSLLGR